MSSISDFVRAILSVLPEEQGCNVGAHGLSGVFHELPLSEIICNTKHPTMSYDWSMYVLSMYSIPNTLYALFSSVCVIACDVSSITNPIFGAERFEGIS